MVRKWSEHTHRPQYTSSSGFSYLPYTVWSPSVSLPPLMPESNAEVISGTSCSLVSMEVWLSFGLNAASFMSHSIYSIRPSSCGGVTCNKISFNCHICHCPLACMPWVFRYALFINPACTLWLDDSCTQISVGFNNRFINYNPWGTVCLLREQEGGKLVDLQVSTAGAKRGFQHRGRRTSRWTPHCDCDLKFKTVQNVNCTIGDNSSCPANNTNGHLLSRVSLCLRKHSIAQLLCQTNLFKCLF